MICQSEFISDSILDAETSSARQEHVMICQSESNLCFVNLNLTLICQSEFISDSILDST
jgi:hypothetical protein